MRAATRAILVSASVLTSMLLGYRIGMAAKPSHCAKDCKQDIKNCLALVLTNKACTGAKAEKTACRKMHAAQRKACRGLVKLCKRQNPGTDGVCVPSRCGTFLTTWGRRGSGNGQFDNPVGVAEERVGKWAVRRAPEGGRRRERERVCHGLRQRPRPEIRQGRHVPDHLGDERFGKWAIRLAQWSGRRRERQRVCRRRNQRPH